MGKAKKLLGKAKSSPRNFKYSELCALAEAAGYEFRRQNGSHAYYKHPQINSTMNFQPDTKTKCMAKPYQVRQLVNAIEHNDLQLKGE